MPFSFPLRSVFLALPLEREAKWKFQALQESLKIYENCLRFQNPRSPHLTLQFWPEVMEIEFKQIVKQAHKIVKNRSPLNLRVTGVDTFGSRGEDKVVFLNIAFSEDLAYLKKACPWPNDKPFSPHITLARISHPQRFAVAKKKVMKEVKDCQFEIPVDRLRLYAEIDGIKQTPLQDFELNRP